MAVKLKKQKSYFEGGIVRLFDDLEMSYTNDLLQAIKTFHNEGHSFEDIGERFNRDPDEIFLALFHLARKGEEVKPFAKRLR